ncbi:MAG: PAS domain S-box protein [Bacteroidales bacterium]|nr:PAS domain S-box protein [Bacteroidales bacterium]
MDYSNLTKKELLLKIEELSNRLNALGYSEESENKNITNHGTSEYENNLNYVSYYENAPDMYFHVKSNGTVVSVNNTGADSLGYEKKELIGEKVWKVVHPEDLAYVKNKINEILEKQRDPGQLEFRKIRKDGTVLFVQEKTRLIRENGSVKGIGINCRDITEQKIILENLKEQEEKYRTLTNNLKVGIYRSTSGPDGKLIEVNPAFINMFGYESREEMLRKNVLDLYNKADDRINLQKDLEKYGFVRNREIELRKKNGEVFTGSLFTVAISDESGTIKYFDGIVDDITDRKQALQELIRKKEQYRTLFDLSPNGILIEDKEGNIFDANPAYCQMMGYSFSELIGKHISSLAVDNSAEVNKNIARILNGEKLRHITKSKTKDGKTIYTELHENRFELDGTLGIICIAHDVTDRINAQKELRESEESYRGLFNSTTDAIYILNKNGEFLDVNEGALSMYGRPKNYFPGKTPVDLSAPGMNDLEQTFKYLQDAYKGKPKTFEFWGIDSNKRVFPKEVRVSKGTYFGKDVIVAFAQDITERRAAQKILEEKEEKFRRIFNAIPDIYFKSNIKGVVEEISPSVYRITGYLPAEIIGQNSKNFYYAPSEWDEIGRLLFQKGEINDFDTQIQHKTGKVLNCSLNARILYDEDNIPNEIEGVLRDITSRKKTELALRESNRRMATLMDNLPGMAYRCLNDRNWTMEFISSGCLALTGYKSLDIINNQKLSYNNIIHPDDRDKVWDRVQQAIQNKKTYRMVYRIVTAKEIVKWVWEQGTGIYDDDGELVALEGLITDITEQRKAEEEIRKLSRSVQQSPNIVMIVDLDAKIEYVNPRFTRVTGYTFEEAVGRNPKFLKSGNTPKETYTAMWDKLTHGQEWYGEFQNRRKNGETYWESANIFPLKNSKGEVTHYIGMKEDITERKKMEKELILAKEKAEESDRLKSAFLANMSHEIRTPMNAIIGFSQLLNVENIGEDDKNHFIDLIQTSGNDLLHLIDDIIDISKIEAGQFKVFKSQYFLDHILKELYDSYKEFLKTKPEKSNITLRFKTPPEGNTVVYTDIDRFKQIFRNLLNNAIKFTESGLIEYGYRLVSKNKIRVIEFYIRDTGIGIHSDKLDIIFESFRQANDSDTKLYGGTGLGLAITRKMVEILGGEIWVKSVKGQGSTFYFTLPYQKFEMGVGYEMAEQKSTKSPLKDIDWEDKSILIVEDDDGSFLYFKNILSNTKISVERAVNGLDAIEKVKNRKFNAILMDIRIPKLNGLETTRRIKKIAQNLPVIAQTAFAMEDEKEKCFAAGCDDYIAKPVQINDFLQIIDKHIK